jgi:hypothetical protein
MVNSKFSQEPKIETHFLRSIYNISDVINLLYDIRYKIYQSITICVQFEIGIDVGVITGET